MHRFALRNSARNRYALVWVVLVVFCFAVPGHTQRTAPAVASPYGGWVATWGAAMMQADFGRGTDVTGQTVRLIVHSSVGGQKTRIWLSNRYGGVPLVVGEAHIAVCGYTDPLTADDGSAILPGSDRKLTFNGNASVTIPAGSTMVSDPVAVEIPSLSNLAVSLYFPEHTEATTLHGGALQTSFGASGNWTGTTSLADKSWPERSWYFLSGIDVYAPAASSVVAFGDSITDGNHSTANANHRWPDYLAVRLQANEATRAAGVLGVVNVGISGNRVLLDGTGPNAMARLDDDVLERSGARYLILFHGINDIEAVTHRHQQYGDLNQRLKWALTQITERAHERGMRVIGATQMPDCHHLHCASVDGEATRQAFNDWIRTTPIFDGVVDFDRITRDPQHPSQLLPAYDSGDGVHPNDAGYSAMADGIDLRLLAAHDRETGSASGR